MLIAAKSSEKQDKKNIIHIINSSFSFSAGFREESKSMHLMKKGVTLIATKSSEKQEKKNTIHITNSSFSFSAGLRGEFKSMH